MRIDMIIWLVLCQSAVLNDTILAVIIDISLVVVDKKLCYITRRVRASRYYDKSNIIM